MPRQRQDKESKVERINFSLYGDSAERFARLAALEKRSYAGEADSLAQDQLNRIKRRLKK